MSQSESFRFDEIVQNVDLVDFITGETGATFGLAAFVENREAGARIVAMFNDLAYFDDRDPDSLQVVVGALQGNTPALLRLNSYVGRNENRISLDAIAIARQQALSYTPAREIVDPGNIGIDTGTTDFVTGNSLTNRKVPHMLMRVVGKHHGNPSQANVVRMFNHTVFAGCDNRIEVATAPENEAALHELRFRVIENGNLITQEIVAQARGVVTKTARRLKVA